MLVEFPVSIRYVKVTGEEWDAETWNGVEVIRSGPEGMGGLEPCHWASLSI